VYINPFQPSGIACVSLAPGSILKSKYIVGVLVLTGDYKGKTHIYEYPSFINYAIKLPSCKKLKYNDDYGKPVTALLEYIDSANFCTE